MTRFQAPGGKMSTAHMLKQSPRIAKGMFAVMAGAFLATAYGPQAEALETRSYVMSSFWHAANSQDGDCPDGLNMKIKEQYAKDLADVGYSQEDIKRMIDDYVGGGGKELMAAVINRGRINGKPVNAYAHPMAVVDPKLKTMDGKYAYGFNLDGKGAAPGSFEDPETHEVGVDHQLARVLGCIEPMRAILREGSAFWRFMWLATKDATPAWTLTVTGEDLNKDGPVTIKLGRAMEPTRYNGNGTARSNLTFRIDPDPRFNKNEYAGQIKDGVISITEPGDILLLQDPVSLPTFSMTKFHARFKMRADGVLEGLIGGYQPIDQIYFSFASASSNAETNYSPELPGIYHSMNRLAEADPDPKTGHNRSISASYYVEFVPAYVMPVSKRAGPNVAAQ